LLTCPRAAVSHSSAPPPAELASAGAGWSRWTIPGLLAWGETGDLLATMYPRPVLLLGERRENARFEPARRAYAEREMHARLACEPIDAADPPAERNARVVNWLVPALQPR
jgi:hypothetical protein